MISILSRKSAEGKGLIADAEGGGSEGGGQRGKKRADSKLPSSRHNRILAVDFFNNVKFTVKKNAYFLHQVQMVNYAGSNFQLRSDPVRASSDLIMRNNDFHSKDFFRNLFFSIFGRTLFHALKVIVILNVQHLE